MKLIKYRFLSSEINHGTEAAPDIEQVILNKQITCADEALEDTLSLVLQEACDGKYTVEDAEPEETDNAPDPVTWAELDAAYREGVDSV